AWPSNGARVVAASKQHRHALQRQRTRLRARRLRQQLFANLTLEYLAVWRHWQAGREDDFFWNLEPSKVLLAELKDLGLGSFLLRLKDHDCCDGFDPVWVRHADHGCHRDFRMTNEGAFNLL